MSLLAIITGRSEIGFVMGLGVGSRSVGKLQKGVLEIQGVHLEGFRGCCGEFGTSVGT